MNSVWEIVIIMALVLLNGLLAMSEMAIIASRKSKLQQLAEAGSRRSALALKLAEKPENLLSAVQIGITSIGILAGVVGGATIAERLALYLENFLWSEHYASAIAGVIVVGSITFVSLVLGELVPKRIALSNPERIAARTAGFMVMIERLTFPLVRLLTKSTNGILHFLGVRQVAEPEVTEEEVKVLLEEGTKAGIFEEVEQDMVESVLTLDNRPISALMTPRTEIDWYDLEDPIEVFEEKIKTSARSVFPVAHDTLDNVLGLIDVKDYLILKLEQKSNNSKTDIREILRNALFIVESTPILKVVEMFKRTGIHIAMIIDEHGVVQGLVTINDVLEAIVGDISLSGEPEAIQRADGSWLVDGMLPLDEFKRIFNIDKWTGEEQGHYFTMGGLLVVHLGRAPKAGDTLNWNGFSFEVVDMDGRRVDKIIVVPPKITVV
ncbi:MAG: HlyC/CorC family transporter [Candidatus Magasanikbacteria bacterium]|nr:HlyC/CorC family transporter [Candidatus Magasanikbacteria bacterium]